MDDRLRLALRGYDSKGYELVLLTPESRALVRSAEDSVLLDRDGSASILPPLRAGSGRPAAQHRASDTQRAALWITLIGLVLGLVLGLLLGLVLPARWNEPDTPPSNAPHNDASALLSPGPTDERTRLFVYSGGTTATLVDAVSCDRGSAVFWTTNDRGRFIAYSAAASRNAQTAWYAHFPDGIPPFTPLLGACR